ncbi:cytochrome c [Colwellia maritima]|uniref:c-type cytochrome n=1 Tax=Colwellia maritima TaxID=2912588 RepID=UPI0030843265
MLANTKIDGLRQLLQLTEYIGVDYASAIADGKVIDDGEYQEMLDFSIIIAEKSATELTEEKQIITLSKSLLFAVQEKKTLAEIKNLTSQLKNLLIENSPQLSLPTSLLAPVKVKQLFQSNCASCHGITGKGDGELATTLTPQPTNFTDKTRALDRSILGLYDALTGGLEGTSMTAFEHLTAKERWSLAFYVGSLGFADDEKNIKTDNVDISLVELVQYTPNELVGVKENLDKQAIEQLRANPNLQFPENNKPPLTIARDQLHKTLMAYKQNDFNLAQQFAVSAYLDGFELIENNLDAYDNLLRKTIESNLLSLRQKISNKENSDDVDEFVSLIMAQLTQAELLLTESTMSDTTLFSAGFIILLREGLEALLVVLALFTILVRSNRQAAVKYLHFGWIAALFCRRFNMASSPKLNNYQWC